MIEEQRCGYLQNQVLIWKGFADKILEKYTDPPRNLLQFTKNIYFLIVISKKNKTKISGNLELYHFFYENSIQCVFPNVSNKN